MPTALRDRDVVTESWLATDALRLAQERGFQPEGFEAASEVHVDPTPTPSKVYPKRSELRRAEARAGRRGGSDRRPGSGHGPTPSAPIIAGRRGTQPVGPAPRARRSTRSVRPDDVTRPIMAVRDDQVAPGQLPLALAPTAAVLPIPHLDDMTRPAGLNLALPRESDAFHRPTAMPTVPIAVPLPSRSPEGRAAEGRAADYDLDDATRPIQLGSDGVPLPPLPLTVPAGSNEPAPVGMRTRRDPKTKVATDRRKVGAARMLVLALVVSAEGVALTQMAGPPHLGAAKVDTGELSSSLSASAVLQDSAERQASAVTAQQEAVTMADAQAESGAGKVAAALDQAKAAADRVKAAEERRARALRNVQRDPRAVGRMLAADRGWTGSQFSCLDSLWNRESQWNYQASNPSSGAYGIPQALPGTKMGSVASDWRTNPVTQMKWGLNYIADRYGTPCGAWGHSESVGWY